MPEGNLWIQNTLISSIEGCLIWFMLFGGITQISDVPSPDVVPCNSPASPKGHLLSSCGVVFLLYFVVHPRLVSIACGPLPICSMYGKFTNIARTKSPSFVGQIYQHHGSHMGYLITHSREKNHSICRANDEVFLHPTGFFFAAVIPHSWIYPLVMTNSLRTWTWP